MKFSIKREQRELKTYFAECEKIMRMLKTQIFTTNYVSDTE